MSARNHSPVPGSGIEFVTLRHAFASALISAGASVKAVSVAMGHTNATTTLQTYAGDEGPDPHCDCRRVAN